MNSLKNEVFEETGLPKVDSDKVVYVNPRITFIEEIRVGMDIVKETIKKYKIFEPENNVVVMWMKGELVICFGHEIYDNWSFPDK